MIDSTDALYDVENRLVSLNTSLETTIKEVEPEFMQLAQNLQSANADAAAITRQIHETVHLIGGESDEGVLVKIGGLVKETLGELKKRQLEVADNLGYVRADVEHLDAFYSRSADIEKIARFLRVCGLNIDIESSRSKKSREMFSVIAQEIRNFSEKVIEIAKNIREDVEAARTSQLLAYEEISEGLNHLQRLGDDARQAVKNSVGEIEQIMGLSLKALEKVGVHTRKISLQVGEIVVAIQFHDNLSQRIDHIAKALNDVGNLSTGAMSASEPNVKNAEELAGACSIVDVQIAQIKQAISEIDAVYQKSRGAFEEIGSEIIGLASSLSSLAHENSGSGSIPAESIKDPFAVLKSALANLHRLLGRGGGLIERMQETTFQASEATTRLFSYMEQVRTLSHETDIIALNAIINAAQMGAEGRTQEVLAQEIKILSDQTRGFVDDVEKVLDSISVSAQNMDIRTPAGSNAAQAADGVAGAKMSLDTGIEEISEAYTQYNENSANVFQGAELLKNAVSHAGAGLEFLPALAGELTGHLKQIEAIREVLSPWAVGDMDETDTLAARYTMQQERDVHEQLITARRRDAIDMDAQDTGSKAGVAQGNNFNKDSGSVSDVLNRGDSEDDLGNTVELFFDENADENNLGDTIKLFADANIAGNDDFGDNVDLF